MKLIFATNNAHKVEEVSAILGDSVEIVTLKECGITEDIPENEPTITGNALAKVRYVHNKLGCDCFADDTGLMVDALGGDPGVRSARYAGDQHNFQANLDLLMENMENQLLRSARFVTVIALILDGKEYTFEGCIEGSITTTAQGEKGFGYDPVFKPLGYEETFAQLPVETKNAISHRALAVKKFVEFINNHKNLFVK